MVFLGRAHIPSADAPNARDPAGSRQLTHRHPPCIREYPLYAWRLRLSGKSRQETMLDAAGARTKRVRQLPRSSGRYSSGPSSGGSSIGRPMRPTRIASPRTLARTHKVGGAVSEGRPCCRALPAAGTADAACTRTISGRISAPVIIAPHDPGRGPWRLLPQHWRHSDRRGPFTRAFIAALEPAKLAATLRRCRAARSRSRDLRAAASIARGGHHNGRARQGCSPPHAALEGRRAQRDRSRAAALAAGHDTHR